MKWNDKSKDYSLSHIYKIIEIMLIEWENLVRIEYRWFVLEQKETAYFCIRAIRKKNNFCHLFNKNQQTHLTNHNIYVYML